MAVLFKNESREELRNQLIQEAAERLRRHPLPPIAEVLEEIRPFRLPDGAPDSTTLLREARGYRDESPQFGPSPRDVAASREWEDDGSVDTAEATNPTDAHSRGA